MMMIFFLIYKSLIDLGNFFSPYRLFKNKLSQKVLKYHLKNKVCKRLLNYMSMMKNYLQTSEDRMEQ